MIKDWRGVALSGRGEVGAISRHCLEGTDKTLVLRRLTVGDVMYYSTHFGPRRIFTFILLIFLSIFYSFRNSCGD